MFGWTELLIVFGILVLLFGASRLPDVARSMGLSVGEFKAGLQEGKEEIQEESTTDSPETLEENTAENEEAVAKD